MIIPPMTPDDVLALLKEGNRRFLADKPYEPHVDRSSRLRMLAVQRPIAAYLSCSDSRVSAKPLFPNVIRGFGSPAIPRFYAIFCASLFLAMLLQPTYDVGMSVGAMSWAS